MFFKVIFGNRGAIVSGNISVEREHYERQYKALRCMSVPLEEVEELIDTTIVSGKQSIVASDIMELSFKAKPTASATLPIRTEEDEAHGWIPSAKVLISHKQECGQFLSWLNQRVEERIDEITNDPSEIINQIQVDLQIADKLSRMGVGMSENTRSKLVWATKTL